MLRSREGPGVMDQSRASLLEIWACCLWTIMSMEKKALFGISMASSSYRGRVPYLEPFQKSSYVYPHRPQYLDTGIIGPLSSKHGDVSVQMGKVTPKSRFNSDYHT